MRTFVASVLLFVCGCGAGAVVPASVAPAPAPDAIPASRVDGQADLEKSIYKAIDARRVELWTCYRKGLTESSPGEGHVILVLEIAQDGRAVHVLEGHRTGIGDDEIKCMSRVLKARPFHDGAASTMRLRVPLTFTREGGA